MGPELGQAAMIEIIANRFAMSVSFGLCLAREVATDRVIEAWYHPSSMNDPQPEGSHGKLHPTTKILSHARRRGRMAARGAGAAGGDAGDRVS